MTSGKSPIFKLAQVGLYRDNCLAVIEGSARIVEKRSENCSRRKSSAKITDFLDVELNLNTGKFKPFGKPNDHPIYINSKSNHPKIIIKQLPKMVAHCISTLSSDKETFDNEIGLYEKALKNSGHNCKLNYVPPEPTKKRVRTRKILYFNPPFSKSVKTKVGALFLKLIDHPFPNHHIFHKIFNRSKVKISYCSPTSKIILQRIMPRLKIIRYCSWAQMASEAVASFPPTFGPFDDFLSNWRARIWGKKKIVIVR